MDICNSSNGLDIDGFINWMTKINRFFEYIETLEEKKSEINCRQIEKLSFYMVG